MIYSKIKKLRQKTNFYWIPIILLKLEINIHTYIFSSHETIPFSFPDIELHKSVQ